MDLPLIKINISVTFLLPTSVFLASWKHINSDSIIKFTWTWLQRDFEFSIIQNIIYYIVKNHLYELSEVTIAKLSNLFVTDYIFTHKIKNNFPLNILEVALKDVPKRHDVDDWLIPYLKNSKQFALSTTAPFSPLGTVLTPNKYWWLRCHLSSDVNLSFVNSSCVI